MLSSTKTCMELHKKRCRLQSVQHMLAHACSSSTVDGQFQHMICDRTQTAFTDLYFGTFCQSA